MFYYLLIGILTGIFIGYNLGFKTGKARGIKMGLSSAPLFFLEKSLERGYCVVCSKLVSDLSTLSISEEPKHETSLYPEDE
ncbi:MAG: hypothetical protein PWR10_1251 [Halanaerobiales bacterium]|nr:hypothetical protein [Halanaerobiales bacterium]